MTGMDWQRLARAIVDRRVDLGYRTREALLADVDRTPHRLSRRVLADLETGRRDNYDQATLVRLEKALEWPSGEVYRILRGGVGELIKVPPAGPRTVDHPVEIARTIARDDFALVWLLANAGLDPAALLRVELLIRARRQELEAKLLPEVEAAVRDLGGTVSYPWDDAEGGGV